MNDLQSRWGIHVGREDLNTEAATICDLFWSDKTGLPVESYTEGDVNTISNEVFKHVYRAYPTVPSPCYAEAA